MSERSERTVGTDPVVRASWVGTAVFTFVAVAAVVGPGVAEPVAVVVDLVLFAAGCVLFGWAFLRAAGRSRTEEISVAGLWLLVGSAPGPVQRALLGSLGVQVAVALATAAARPYTSLAFGVLVPVYGLGLCGVWGAASGTFPPRKGTGGRATMPPGPDREGPDPESPGTERW